MLLQGMGSIGLKALSNSFPLNKFLTNYWPSEPFVIHCKKHFQNELIEHPLLQSLDAILASRPDHIKGFLPNVNDEYNSVILNTEDAIKAFNCKMGLGIKPNYNCFPELLLWLSSIRSELGLSNQTASKCCIYAIPDKAGTCCHFDPNINFVIQITGQKTWELSPNVNCVNPITRHVLNTPVEPVTASHSKLPFPKKIPSKNKKTVVLKRGSILFLPRGYWHQTRASGDSISLNFIFTQPTWADLTAEFIRKELLKNENWRGAAFGLRTKNQHLRESAAVEIRNLLQNFPIDLNKINLKNIE